ncbi:MAG: hypothetical protein RL375_4168 [Pseudomonadota bacterium]
MAGTRARYIADLLQVHLDDLAFLWGQRRAALNSRKHTLREYGELNERIEAHLQGLLVADAPALLELLKPQLTAKDRDEAFAAGYGLLRLNDAAVTHIVVVEFLRAEGGTLAGLRDALSLAPHALFSHEMQGALVHAKPFTAVSAAVVLANHRLLDGGSERLSRLLTAGHGMVCELAWRAATLCDAAVVAGSATTADELTSRRPYRHVLAHESPTVRHAGWGAVAWSGQQRAMAALRQAASAGDRVALHWLAVLGDEADVAMVQRAGVALADVPACCEVLARLGHVSSVPAFLQWMEGADVLAAAAAGEAFTRITGIHVRGRRITAPVPDDADEFTREMAPDVWLPDARKARAEFERHSDDWAQGSRWCRGLRVDASITREVLMQLDLDARWDAAARAALAGRAVSVPPPVH